MGFAVGFAKADEVSAIAPGAPVLLALQWADQLSRFAVRMLASRLSDSPVVWALSARTEPGQVLADLSTAETFEGVTVEHVELGPLAEADVIAIATDILGAPPAAGAAARLRRAGGNPLLAVQFSEGLALDRARGRDADTIPTSLATALRARTRSLGPDTMGILQLAAVWGRPMDLATAAQMLGSVTPGDAPGFRG